MAQVIDPISHEQKPDRFVRKVVIAVTISGLVYLAWQVREVTMIIFGGILLATMITAAAGRIRQFVPLPEKPAVGITVLLFIFLIGLTGWWVGDSIAAQFGELQEKLPQAFDAFREWLRSVPLGSALADEWGSIKDAKVPWADVAVYTGTALGALANAVLILAIGLYLAASPGLYQRGLVRLIPPVYRQTTEDGLSAAANGLRSWLLGQLFTMSVIGVLTAIGLYLLDIPLAIPLGIIAGLLEFVPFIGPLVFAVLAVVLAFTEGPTAALYVALLTIGLQQLESYVLTPLIQRRTVELPPALGLVSVIIFGGLFGVPGILLATPLMVVIMILVKRLYVERALENEKPS